MPAGRPTAAARLILQGDQTARNHLGVAKLSGEPEPGEDRINACGVADTRR